MSIATLPNKGPPVSIYEARMFNGYIEKAVIVAKTKSGALQISFKLRADPGISARRTLLIRLFDRNGAYLTHVLSQEMWQVFGIDHLQERDHVYDVAYTLPIRDLRDATFAELGFLMDH